MTEKAIKDKIIETIKEIYDPEIPVNIYELGLIYKVTFKEKSHPHILMTLTSPNCPAADIILQEVHDKVGNLEEVDNITVELTFDPPYDPGMMSDAAKLELGFE